MIADILLILWLRWRQFRVHAIYWLRVIGLDTRNPSLSNKLYVVYFVIFSLAWVVLMWIFGVSQACIFGAKLPAEARQVVLQAVPWVVLVAQAFLMWRALRSTPLKLSFADTAYLAGSPTARSAAALVMMVKSMATWLLAIVPVAAMFAVVMDVPLGEVVNLSGSPAALVAIPLAAFSFGLAWALGMARIAGLPVLRSPFSWALPVVWVAAAGLVPDVMLWPGRALATGVEGQVAMADLLILAALALVVIVGVGWVSRRANLIQANDESVLYARLGQVGFMAWTQPGLSGAIKAEVSLASRGAWWTLPPGQGLWAVAGRAALAFIRHPMNLATAVVGCASYAYTGTALLLSHAPVQLWLPWLFVLVIVSPRSLLGQYRADLKEPFLRQMLPFDNLGLLIADAALPLAIAVVGLTALTLVPDIVFSAGLLYIVFLVLVLALLVLCLGLDDIKGKPFGVRVSSGWAMVICLGLMMGLNNISQGPFLSLMLGMVAIFLLVSGLRTSYS